MLRTKQEIFVDTILFFKGRNVSAVPKGTKRHTYNAPAKNFYTERWNEPNSKSNLTKRRKRVDLEVKPDTHGRQLDVQIPQDTRDGNERGILAADPFLASLVLPAVVPRHLNRWLEGLFGLGYQSCCIQNV